MSTPQQSPAPQVGKLVSVIPVGLKEAALDSPTFRATTVHFSDQIDFVERWLDGYVKSTGRMVSELGALDNATTSFLYHATGTMNVSEAILDHDYTLLAMKRHGEMAKEFWTGMISTAKKFDALVVEPIRTLIAGDLRAFKEIRRVLEQSQKQYDHLQFRFSAQAKSKEPSSLREDAFQLHEARKIYMKASMDFSVQAPQVKNTLDKLLVRVFFDQWRELKGLHDNNATAFAKSAQEMERVKGWIHEMENTEKSSRRELLSARKKIEDAAELAARPSRELEDYSISTVPYLGSQAPSTLKISKGMTFKPEKQGWLNLRTFTGKPTRTVWVRRWAFLKNGIFGCLVHGTRTGGVEESERIGVLLCGIRPAFQEERRFCFEVKTNNNTIMLQTETQTELMEWIGAFEAAKQKALENPANTDLSVSGRTTVQDPAFAISQPPAPEFAADLSDSLTPNANDEVSAPDRTPNLSVPDRDGLARSSADFTNTRRHTGLDRDPDGGRDHTSRIIQKLDLHRKPPPGPQAPWPVSGLGPSGGLPGMASTDRNFLPFGGAAPGNVSNPAAPDTTFSSFAPTTLANPPAATSMSKAAVVVYNERGIGVGLADNTGGMPSGIMANLWGSSNWGFINRLERDDTMPHGLNENNRQRSESQSTVASKTSTLKTPENTTSPPSQVPASRHRQTVSLDGDLGDLQIPTVGKRYEYPSYYPALLKTHDAQFRLLFPNVGREESLVLVFRATWSPNDQQEFPGRTYVTTKTIYFYSNSYGLVLTTSSDLDCVTEVTAAPGRDCDFLFLHLTPARGSDTPRRITVKTFLEPFRLLRKRLNFLAKNITAEEPLGLEGILKALVKLEQDGPTRSPSVDSWEDVSLSTPVDEGLGNHRIPGKKSGRDLRAPIYVDNALDVDSGKAGFGKDILKFRLPAQPVEYVPQGELHTAAEKVFDVSPKALFHVLFGDKSVVWQLLQHERSAQDIKQGPWTNLSSGHMTRDFEYMIETTDILGRSKKTKVADYQIVDVFNDHLCYVITDKQTPWHLPFKRYFRLVSKIVITHVAKSKSKLAIFTKVEWLWTPILIKHAINQRAMNDLEQDALDLVDLVSDQVTKLGPRSRTKKAMFVFGDVGRQTQVSQFSGAETPLPLECRRPRKQRALLPLLVETSGSLLQSAISSLMIWTFALLRWIWKTSSANGFILLLLFSSLLFNGFYTSRDTYQWWHERNAWKFVSRLGIQPDNVMSKAIYVQDMDEVIANATGIGTYNNTSTCFSTFWDQNSISDANLPLPVTAYPDEDPTQKSASRRLRRTLQRLATSRHDLLVGLRVINSIEKEVLLTEWERWLQQETNRCEMIDAMLNSGEEGDDGVGAQRFFSERTEDVRRWYADYCLSCQRDRTAIMGDDRRMSTL